MKSGGYRFFRGCSNTHAVDLSDKAALPVLVIVAPGNVKIGSEQKADENGCLW